MATSRSCIGWPIKAPARLVGDLEIQEVRGIWLLALQVYADVLLPRIAWSQSSACVAYQVWIALRSLCCCFGIFVCTLRPKWSLWGLLSGHVQLDVVSLSQDAVLQLRCLAMSREMVHGM